MLRITAFSGHDGQWSHHSQFYLTLFGGCSLTKPTLARQIVLARELERNDDAKRAEENGSFFLTLFGAVEIKWPTLAEEYIDFSEMLRTGALRMEEWDSRVTVMSAFRPGASTLTLFAGFDENEIPNEKDEIEALAIQRHLGNISESVGRILQLGIGKKGSERTSIIRRAVMHR